MLRQDAMHTAAGSTADNALSNLRQYRHPCTPPKKNMLDKQRPLDVVYLKASCSRKTLPGHEHCTIS